MEVRFSDAFLASHRINQRLRVDKECKHIHVVGLDTCLAFKFSPLCLILPLIQHSSPSEKKTPFALTQNSHAENMHNPHSVLYIFC